jgi:hypothetical protein
MYSCVQNLHFLIPGYVFLTMSFEKSPIAHSWLCFPGYVAHEISNIVFLAISFLALSCANTREPIPGYVECENPIPGYVVPGYARSPRDIDDTLSALDKYSICHRWVLQKIHLDTNYLPRTLFFFGCKT